jgi:Uri superfamily endonuclease
MADERHINNTNNGSYVLVLSLGQPCRIRAGRLPERNYPAGLYFYIGRAKRNLRGRLARHLTTEKKLFWHIDYLLRNAEIEEIWCRPGYFDECQLASDITGMCGKDSSPIPGFGASDCHCSSHLIYYSGEGSLLNLLRNKINHRKVKIDDIKNNPF